MLSSINELLLEEHARSQSLRNFGIPANDPGFVYVFRNGLKFKIGRTKVPKRRLAAARTWVPDIEIIGIKPFWQHRAAEHYFQLGLARYWNDKEWYIEDGNDEFIEDFYAEIRAFDDFDINTNSINFIYCMNGTGMSEFVIEHNRQRKSKKAFLVQETS